MVSKKRLDYGFNGYRAPIIPRAPRSIRRRGPRKNSIEDSKLCAFELLAAVAGKLLQESESSASSNVANGKVQPGICQGGNEKEQSLDDKALKSESFERGSCAESAFVPEISIQEQNQAENNSVLEQTSVRASSDIPKKVDCDIKLGTGEVKNADGNTISEVEGSICCGDSLDRKVEGGAELHARDDNNQIIDSSLANTSTVKDPIEEDVNTNLLIKSEGSVQLPLYRDPIPDALLQKHWNNVQLGIRDDDENSFGCNKSSTRVRPFRPQPRIGHRRIRKMLTSKYRKVAPKLKGCGLYNTGEGIRSFYQYRKRIYTQERFQQAPIKKRKLSDHTFAVAYHQDTSSDSISNLPEKGTKMDNGSSSANILQRASGTPATVRGHQKAKDSHVKFSIKSFRVPELYIEVPETASVGSLKRTVMEAVTAILGNGIRVGVVLQGKKVRDDNRTLQQAGISQSTNLDTLGFTLEPSFSHVSPSMTPKKLPSALPCDPDQELPSTVTELFFCFKIEIDINSRSYLSVESYHLSSNISWSTDFHFSIDQPFVYFALQVPCYSNDDSGIGNASVDPPVVNKFDDVMDNENLNFSPQTPKNEPNDASVPDSKALVPVPPMNAEALAVVPVNPKPKRTELSQRRTRRPFSVAEVEALVAAVEKLGTGRWRDVKLGAFENADHRTYVDLKDKWKTLVHTASISPQQRRGEAVPQELLDRVLSAHSYWSQHQSKQQGKHQPSVES
ncbi:Telomere repeat-binding protein 4 [Sesamum angolense]|uniref:Telomere repeat-binding protein 4 n=1 Tax=Sesamum angolense TaxID=2727404 RepID=A0AAE1X115_9LAMI|nr:Telomere repeat-binding protein 4 [Sesamum angolense]